MYGFFRYCENCAVLWHDVVESTCWLCDGPGTKCEDSFVYTAPSMYGSEDVFVAPLLGVNFVAPWVIDT